MTRRVSKGSWVGRAPTLRERIGFCDAGVLSAALPVGSAVVLVLRVVYGEIHYVKLA